MLNQSRTSSHSAGVLASVRGKRTIFDFTAIRSQLYTNSGRGDPSAT